MFIKKEIYRSMQIQILRLRKENELKDKQIKNLEEEKRNMKSDLENEHLENYEQHKKLLKIENALKGKFGSYIDLLNFRNKVQSIIKNELAPQNNTNSNH